LNEETRKPKGGRGGKKSVPPDKARSNFLAKTARGPLMQEAEAKNRKKGEKQHLIDEQTEKKIHVIEVGDEGEETEESP